MFNFRGAWAAKCLLQGAWQPAQLQDTFRTLSRAGATVQEHVAKPEQGYPMKLIATLENPALLKEVLK